MPDKMEWLIITGLWKSKSKGYPTRFLATRKDLQDIIDKLNSVLNKADFSDNNGVYFNISPNTPQALRANPKRPIWLLKTGIQKPLTQVQTEPQPPQEPVQVPTIEEPEEEFISEPVGSFDSEY